MEWVLILSGNGADANRFTDKIIRQTLFSINKNRDGVEAVVDCYKDLLDELPVGQELIRFVLGA